MPRASVDEYLAGYRQLAPGARLKLWRPYAHRLDWDGHRSARAALVAADLTDLAPTGGPSASDTREPCESPLAVAEPAARPSAPRPSPATAPTPFRQGCFAA